MGRHRTDYRLWALLTAGVWSAAVAVDYLAADHVFGGRLARLIPDRPADTLVIDVCNALCLSIPAAAVGWLAQAVAVLCGVHLSDRPTPPSDELPGSPGSVPGRQPASPGEPDPHVDRAGR